MAKRCKIGLYFVYKSNRNVVTTSRFGAIILHWNYSGQTAVDIAKLCIHRYWDVVGDDDDDDDDVLLDAEHKDISASCNIVKTQSKEIAN